MNLKETVIGTKMMFEGQIIKVRVDTVRLPDGTEASREIVEHNGGVTVVALDENENVYMVQQYRCPIGDILLELPAGKLDHGDEDPLTCGKRELREETGLEAEQYDYLGSVIASPGFSDEKIHIYLARKLTYAGIQLDPGEFLVVEKYPLSELLDMVMENKIDDGKTVIGLLKAAEYLRREKSLS